MLLQTFLQLNILILATPALAGWSLLPPVHGTVRVACIVWHRVGTAPTAALAAETRQVKRVRVLPAVITRAAAATLSPPVFVSHSVPPYAARAP